MQAEDAKKRQGEIRKVYSQRCGQCQFYQFYSWLQEYARKFVKTLVTPLIHTSHPPRQKVCKYIHVCLPLLYQGQWRELWLLTLLIYNIVTLKIIFSQGCMQSCFCLDATLQTLVVVFRKKRENPSIQIIPFRIGPYSVFCAAARLFLALCFSGWLVCLVRRTGPRTARSHIQSTGDLKALWPSCCPTWAQMRMTSCLWADLCLCVHVALMTAVSTSPP